MRMQLPYMCVYICVCVCVYTYIYLYIVHWSWVLFKASVSLLIFWLDDLSIDVTGVFKVLYYYCVTVNFSIYLLIFMYLGAPLLDACVCVCVCVYVDSVTQLSLDHSICGIFQARMLEQVAISYTRGSSQPRDQTNVSVSPALASGFFTSSATWEVLYIYNSSVFFLDWSLDHYVISLSLLIVLF